MEDNSFLGTGWAFPPAFDRRSRGAALVSAEEDIRQSLRILFGTTPGERVMQPTYGCDLRFMVFEELTDSTLTDIRDMIERAIRFFEVRITLEYVHIDESEWLEGVLRIGLDYTIRSTNTRSNLVFPLYLREGTSVGRQA
ncbi:MAG TPA: GPW/gp25 family protein [Phenylobacterium sp.]|jgi:phage baseplate assembly protein W